MKKIILLLSLMASISISAQKRKATLTFNDGHTETGLAKIEGAYDKIIKFRSKKGSKIFYYNYETVKSINIEMISGFKKYIYKTKKKKKPVLVMVNSANEENGTIKIYLKDKTVVTGTSKFFYNSNNSNSSINNSSLSNLKIKVLTKDGEKKKISYKLIESFDIVKDGEDCTYKYVFLKGKNKPKLLKVFIEGAICLYGTENFIERGAVVVVPIPIIIPMNKVDIFLEYFICKKGDAYVTKFAKGNNSKSKKIKDKNIEYFNDCPKLIEKIKSNEYLFKDMIDIVKYYNSECK